MTASLFGMGPARRGLDPVAFEGADGLVSELGETHGRWMKGLPEGYSIATAGIEAAWTEATPGEPLDDDDEYRAAVEHHAGRCECGGQFRFDAPWRCPACRSSRVERGMAVLHYD